jgi:hypothetical protein
MILTLTLDNYCIIIIIIIKYYTLTFADPIVDFAYRHLNAMFTLQYLHYWHIVKLFYIPTVQCFLNKIYDILQCIFLMTRSQKYAIFPGTF